jgi:hypothetical protein
MNIWKTLFISLILIGLIIGGGIGIYNSDWLLNKQLKKTIVTDKLLGGKVTISYTPKYEKDTLKFILILKNIDEKMLIYYRNFGNKDEYIFNIIFKDKEGYNITNCEIFVDEFINSKSEGGYIIQKSIKISKDDARKIKEIYPSYRALLIMTPEEFINQMFNFN